jgi:hypothetical protein
VAGGKRKKKPSPRAKPANKKPVPRPQSAATGNTPRAKVANKRATPRPQSTATGKTSFTASWREIGLVSLAALAVVGDIIGITDGAPALQFSLGTGLLIVGLLISIFRRQQRFLRSPMVAGIGIATAGILVFGLALNGLSIAHANEERQANAEVCSAAQDYYEAYVAAATMWAASGLRTAETQRADARTEDNLERLSRAATRAKSNDFEVLVHDIRMRGSLGRAQDNTDPAGAITNLEGSWTSTNVLLSLCSQKGFPIAQYGRLPVEPNIESACRYLDQSVSYTSKNPPKDWTSDQHRKFVGLLNMFLYHGLNAPDEEFNDKARALAGTIGKDFDPDFDRLGPVYGECVARGFKMSLADVVPREHVTGG